MQTAFRGLDDLMRGAVDAVVFDGPHGIYVQFGRVDPHSRTFPFEAVSNTYLDPARRLDAAKEQVLRDLGFNEPLPSGHPHLAMSPNWSQLVPPGRTATELTGLAFGVLALVYGVAATDVRVMVEGVRGDG